MIRQLPPAPSRDRPNEFSGEMDAFLASMQGFADDANALEQAMELVATTGTSTTSMTVGVGSKSLTTAPGKAWATGAWVYVFAAAAVSNYMVGRVTSYDVDTGALVVNVSAIDGSGTHSSWIIGLATPVADGHLVARDGTRAMTAELTLSGNAANALGAVPKQQAEEIASSAAEDAAAGAVADRMRVSRIAPVATTGGASVALSASIPSWAKEIDIVFAGVSIDSSNSILVQIGAGGLATSGYASTSTTANNASATSAFASTNGFAVELAGGPPNALRGTMRLIKLDGAANTWVQSHSMTKNANNSIFGGGEITLAGALTHISLVCNSVGDAFDAGSASVVVKG